LDAPVGKPAEPSIGELFGRLADDGKAYLRAEAGVYRTIAARRAGLARNGVIALVAAYFLVTSALIVLLVGFALQLAKWVGPALGGLIVFVLCGAIAFFLMRYGIGKMSALGGDAEERAALAAGERAA
jgi:hypothetical protein